MYLTYIPLVSGDDYAQHQHVKSIFPGDQKVLFQQQDSGLLVWSSCKPLGDYTTKEVDVYSYAKGSTYPFTIRLNPVKRDAKTRKRVGIDPEQVKAWIRKQLTDKGMSINFQYVREGVRRSQKKGATISHASVLCFGTLTVTDAKLFSDVLTAGIGHGKGFGFGFLNIFG